MADREKIKAKNKCDRLVIVWCASTEIFIKPGPQHATIAQFEKASLVAKLKAARVRKRAAAGKCEGRKSWAGSIPNVFTMPARLKRVERRLPASFPGPASAHIGGITPSLPNRTAPLVKEPSD